MNIFRKEPAIIIGAVSSILVVVQEYASAHQTISWRALLPVAITAIIRQFVSSPATVQALSPPAQGDHAAP